ncbi:MAG: hypothetical protein V1789_07985 [PVC group bacterium]
MTKTIKLLTVLMAILAVTRCGEKVVDPDQTVKRGGLLYEVHSETPFTGKVVSYYHNDQKSGEGEFRDGKPHGKMTKWYEDGQKKVASEFRDGEVYGTLTEWYENGQKKAEEEFLDGEWISRKCWDKNGKPIDCPDLF